MTDSRELGQLVHDCILGQGRAGQERYYDELRRIGIKPTPAEKAGSLFNPNPVVLARPLVDLMIADLLRFCDHRAATLRGPRDLLATMPASLKPLFGGEEIAARLQEDLKERHPFVCLDAFLVEGASGLEPAYIEWQTFPAYPITALYCLRAMRRAFPGIEENGGAFSARRGESLEDLAERMRAVFLAGIEDDPRQGVILDYRPEEQETSFEFDLSQDFSGGRERGLGIIDPRDVRFENGRPVYRRGQEWIPIRSVFSRLVHGDMEKRLLPELGLEERERVQRFFNHHEDLLWQVHPLHFLYGTKGDFPGFQAAGLSPHLPSCESVTESFIAEQKRLGHELLKGRVQKPVEGNGGRDVILDPAIDQLVAGALLQDRIDAVASHPTLDGPRTPEVRVMGIPGPDGRLFCSSVFTRVKAPEEFRSNAGAIARVGRAGTGEGYALFVD